MRGTFAATMILAHCAGLLVMAIIVTLTSSEPGLGSAVSPFMAGLMFSSAMFGPELWETVALSTAITSLTMALLLRSERFVLRPAAASPSTA